MIGFERLSGLSLWRRGLFGIVLVLGLLSMRLHIRGGIELWKWTWSMPDPSSLAKVLYVKGCLGGKSCGLEGLASKARQRRAVREKFYYYDAIAICGVPAKRAGGASWMQRYRVGLALRLYRAGLAPWVIFSGGAVHNKHVEAEVMAKEAIRQGIPKEAILQERWARHTTGNVRYTLIKGVRRGWRRVLIVSDWWHTLYVTRFAGEGGYGEGVRTRYFSSIRGVEIAIRGCPGGGDRAPFGRHEPQSGAPRCVSKR